MKIRVGIAYDVRDGGELPDPDALADHLADVMDALMELDRITDPDVSATLTQGHVEVTLVLDAPDELAAVEVGVAAVRRAIHAAGGTTRWAVAGGPARVTTENLELSPA